MADFHLQGTYANRASGNTISISAGYGVAVDALLVFFLVFDNTSATAPTVSSITKAPGETSSWQLLSKWDSPSASSGAGLRGEIWAIKATVTWPSSFPVTATLSASVGAQLGGLMDFANITPTIVASAVRTSTTGQTNVTSAGATPSIGDLAIAMAGWETNSDPSITVGGWTGWLNGTTGGGNAATHLRQSFAFTDVTTANQQTYSPTGASVDSGVIVVVLKAGPPPLPTAGVVNSQSNGYAEAVYADVTPGSYANSGFNVYRDTGLAAPNQWELVNTMPPGSTRLWWDKWAFNSGNSSRGNVEVDARFVAHLGFSGVNATGEGPIASGAGLWTYVRPRPASGWTIAANPNGRAVDITIPPLPYDAIAKIFRDGMLVGVPWIPANTSYVFTDDDQGLGLGSHTPPVVLDTFTAPDGTAVTSRAADTGQSWTGGAGWTIVGNQLKGPGNGPIVSVPQPSSDGVFQVDMAVWSRGSGVYFRYTPGTQQGFYLIRDTTNGTNFEIHCYEDGVGYSPVVSKAATSPLNTASTLTVMMSGTDITATIVSPGYADVILTTTSAVNATASGTVLGVKEQQIVTVDNFTFTDLVSYSYTGHWRADQTHYSQGWSGTGWTVDFPQQIQPETPKQFSACAHDVDRIRLRWRKRAYPATYKIYRDGVLVHTTAQDETTWDDLAVVEGNSYSYEVSTVVGANESARTAPVVALCEAAIYIVPTGVQWWSTTGTPSSSNPYNGGTTSDGILATYHPSETSAAGSLYSYADQLVKYPGCLDTDTGLILTAANVINSVGGNETGPLTQVLSLQAEIIANLPPNRVPVNFQLFRHGAGNDSGTQPNQTSTSSVGTYGATLTTSGISASGTIPSQQSVLAGAGETQVVMTYAEENFLTAKASSLQTDPNKRFKDKVNYQKWSWLGINLDLRSTASSVPLSSGSITYSLYVRVGLGDPPPPAPAPTNFRFSYISGYNDLQMQWDTVPGYNSYLLSNDDGFFPETVVGNPPYRVMSVPMDKQGTTSTWSVRAKPLSDESSLAATLSVPYALPDAPALSYSQMGLARGVRVFWQPSYTTSTLVEPVLERDGIVVSTSTVPGFFVDDVDMVAGQKYVYTGYYRAIADHSNVSHDIVPLEVWYGEELTFSPASDISLDAGGTLVGGATFSSVVDEPWDSTSLSDYYDFPPTASTDVNIIAMLQMPPLTHPLGWLPKEVYVRVGSALPPGAVAASDLYVRLVNPTSTPSAEQVMMPLGATYSSVGSWPADGLGFYVDKLATFLSTVVPAWWNSVRLKLTFSNQSYESDMRGLRVHNVKVNVVFTPPGGAASGFSGWGIKL